MDDDRLTPDQRRAMLDLLEQSALNDYPNPDRVGCPGAAFLKRLATNRKSVDLDDPALDHVARCSPCFTEFTEFRAAGKRALVTRRALIGTGAVAAAGLAVVAIRSNVSRSFGPATYQTLEVNLFDAGQSRGGKRPNTSTLMILPGKRLDLRITLPFASPEGEYELQVLHANGEATGLKASGTAQLVAGKTSLRTRLDLTALAPGQYQIGIRRIPFDWMPVPVQIR